MNWSYLIEAELGRVWRENICVSGMASYTGSTLYIWELDNSLLLSATLAETKAKIERMFENGPHDNCSNISYG